MKPLSFPLFSIVVAALHAFGMHPPSAGGCFESGFNPRTFFGATLCAQIAQSVAHGSPLLFEVPEAELYTPRPFCGMLHQISCGLSGAPTKFPKLNFATAHSAKLQVSPPPLFLSVCFFMESGRRDRCVLPQPHPLRRNQICSVARHCQCCHPAAR